MIVILLLGIEILLSGLVVNVISAELLQYIFLSINFIAMTFFISKKIKNQKIFYILFFGFFIRILVLFVDLHIGRVPFSGDDTEVFHRKAVEIAYQLSNQLPVSYGPYDQFIGTIYYLMGNASRVFVQSINIVLFMISSITTVKLLNSYRVSTNIIAIVVGTIMFFMPVSIFNSSILLREMIIIFGITQSMYHMLKWMDNGKLSNISFSIIFVLLAGDFHSGVNIILSIYTIIFLTYSVKKQSFKINFNKIIVSGAILISILILTNIISTQYIFDKIGDYQWTANSAGSGYLTGLSIEAGWQLLLYSPLKIFYFLFSPLPWMVRGLSDVLSFLFDSSMYLIAVIIAFKFLRNRQFLSKRIEDRIMVLYVSYLVLSLPYAWGTVAAGTAVRHRQKGVFLLIIATGLYLHFIKIKGEKNES